MFFLLLCDMYGVWKVWPTTLATKSTFDIQELIDNWKKLTTINLKDLAPDPDSV